MTERALIAMSGGVDSSVAACLIKEQGYDATALLLSFLITRILAKRRRKPAGRLMILTMREMFAEKSEYLIMFTILKTALKKM